jgi:hypothetical protein
MRRSYEELLSLFRRLGARDPEGWARSEATEGIPQLLRFLVLRGMWASVIGDGETGWIQAKIVGSQREPNAPTSGIGAALERLLAAGAAPLDLADVVRGMQFQTLHRISYLLGDSDAALDGVRHLVPELEDLTWQLWGEDGDGGPARRIDMLHESVLETDPTGREMRPR